MELFLSNRINPRAFEDDLCRATRDLSDVWDAAASTQSPLVETTHFLMVLGRIPGGVTQKSLLRRGLTMEQWERGLVDCARRAPGGRPSLALFSSLDDGAKEMMRSAQVRGREAHLQRASEALLLWAGLKHVTHAVRDLAQAADINLDEWCKELEDIIRPSRPLPVFAESVIGSRDASGQPTPKKAQAVVMESFNGGGRTVLRLLKSETEALGYSIADPRHLLMALLQTEGGVTQYGLHHQGVAPRKVQETVMLSLRSKAKKTRSSVPLDAEHMQPTLQHILTLAGQLAEQAHASRIGEPHLLRAFLAVDSTARSFLADQKVDLPTMRKTAEEYEALSEEEDADDGAIADIRTVESHLKKRLVGQDSAIKQILPYIEYMRFGLTTPGHPIGVFLFCGQSGSGKTEMAKELARAVYGSEENLIFLEMGQFNAPESMNIFVGAPPGYIGYGEGKLTNGLRDKPRAVVLFDEVEKAHNKVLDALLRFLDEGKIDDPAGPVRDGSQCIVILTSNVAAEKLDDIWNRVAALEDKQTEIRKQLREEFKKHNFRIEFLNRVDEVLLFNSLKEQDYVEIADRFLKRFLAALQDERLVTVDYGPEVPKAIGGYCATLNEGARSVPRVARTLVILPAIRYLLENRLTPPVRLMVRAKANPGREPESHVERIT